MRAMTIAAFRVAQNNTQLSQARMSTEILEFLVPGNSAINYWIREGRLSRIAAGYRLEPDGLAECQNTLLGRAGAYSTSEENVREWVNRMLVADSVVTQTRPFDGSHWQNTA